jgi:Flp pilus assembly protein TadD
VSEQPPPASAPDLSPGPIESAAAAHLIETGWRAYQKKNLPGALHAYQEALNRSPRDASLWFDVGCLLALSHDAENAREAFRQALSLDPSLPDLHDALGQLDEQDGLLSEARISYTRAADLDASNTRFLRRLVRICLRLDDPTAARDALVRLLRFAPGDVDARYQLGVLELRAGLLDLALHEFQQVVDRAPDHVMAWNGIGLAYARLGAFDDASEALDHARTLQPDHPATQTNLGLLAASQRHWDEARAAWQHAMQLQPEYPPASRNLEALNTLLERPAP